MHQFQVPLLVYFSFRVAGSPPEAVAEPKIKDSKGTRSDALRRRRVSLLYCFEDKNNFLMINLR